MPETFLYAHSSALKRSGYQIVATSHGLQRPEQSVDVTQCIESLSLDPRELAGQTGWIWLDLPSGNRLFGRIHADGASGPPTLVVRAIRLAEEECRAIAWDPFILADVLADDALWKVDGRGWLQPLPPIKPVPPPPDGQALPSPMVLPWWMFAAQSESLLRQVVQSVGVAGRSRLQFVAPCRQARTDLTVQFIVQPAAIGTRSGLARRWVRWVVVATGLVGVLILVAILASLLRDNGRLRVKLGERDNEIIKFRDEHPASRPGPVKSTASEEFARNTYEAIRTLWGSSSGKLKPKANTVQQWETVRQHLRPAAAELPSDQLPERVQDALTKWEAFEKLSGASHERINKLNGLIDQLIDRLGMLVRSINAFQTRLKAGGNLPSMPDPTADPYRTTLTEVNKIADDIRRMLPPAPEDQPAGGRP